MVAIVWLVASVLASFLAGLLVGFMLAAYRRLGQSVGKAISPKDVELDSAPAVIDSAIHLPHDTSGCTNPTRKDSVLRLLESPLQMVVHMLRQMQQDDALRAWVPQLEEAAHTLASHTLHELWLPAITQDGHRMDELWKMSSTTQDEFAQVADLLDPRQSAGDDNWREGEATRTSFGDVLEPSERRPTTSVVPLPVLRDMHEVAVSSLSQHLCDWDFGPESIFGHRAALGDSLLFFSFEAMLKQLGLMERLQISPDKLHALSSAITGCYRAVPYHNSMHMVDVVHSFFWLLHQDPVDTRTSANIRSAGSGATRRRGHSLKPPVYEMPPHVLLSALLAAALHDIGHDGLNNALHVASGSETALTYNDRSVMENMHASIGLRLLVDPSRDVINALSRAQYTEMRKLITDMILGTDMSFHFEQLAQFQVKLEEGLQFDVETPHSADLSLFLTNTLHAADLGSSGRPSELYFAWAQRVFLEFLNIGDHQKAGGHEVLPFMDRDAADLPKAQQGFLKFICKPLFSAIATFVPTASILLVNLGDSLEIIHELHGVPLSQLLHSELSQLLPSRPKSAYGRLAPPRLAPPHPPAATLATTNAPAPSLSASLSSDLCA